jgi:hypothetical protein
VSRHAEDSAATSKDRRSFEVTIWHSLGDVSDLTHATRRHQAGYGADMTYLVVGGVSLWCLVMGAELVRLGYR